MNHYTTDSKHKNEGAWQRTKNLLKHVVPISLDRYHRIRKDQKLVLNNIAELQKDVELVKNDIEFLFSLPKNSAGEIAISRQTIFEEMYQYSRDIYSIQLAQNILLQKLDQVCRENKLVYWIDYGTLLGAVRHQGFIPWDDDTDVSMMRADALRLKEILENDPDFIISELFIHTETNSFNHNLQLKFKISENHLAPYCLDIFIKDYAPNHDIEGSAYKVVSERKKEHRLRARQIWQSYESEGFSERDPNVVDKLRALFDEYNKKAFDEAGLSLYSGDSIILAIDNFSRPYSFQGNYSCDDIFPLVELEFENRKYFAPKNWETQLNDKYGNWKTPPKNIFQNSHFNLSDFDRENLRLLLTKFRG